MDLTLNIFFMVKQSLCIAVYIQIPCAPGQKYDELISHRITLLAVSIVGCEGKGGLLWVDHGWVGIVTFVTILVYMLCYLLIIIKFIRKVLKNQLVKFAKHGNHAL
jgi:hypothetical protein